MGLDRRAWHKANKFNERGRACADAGDWDDALSFYRQPSATPTLEVQVTVANEPDCHALTDMFDQAGFAAQDWTASVRMICRQCSEGHPPASHEHPAGPPGNERRFGLAAPVDLATRLLAGWAAAQPEHRHHGQPVAIG